MKKYQICYTKTGGIHTFYEDGLKERLRFYKMFELEKGFWTNRRLDIYIWEVKNDN